MFSDRLWILKLVVAAGLLGLLGHHARKALDKAQPEVERVALFSDQLRDRTLFFSNYPVLEADSTGVHVQTKVGPMHLRTTERIAVGEVISAVVRPVGPRQLEAVRLEVNEGFRWKRPLNYCISVLTVIVYFLLIRHWFRWNPEVGLFRSRY